MSDSTIDVGQLGLENVGPHSVPVPSRALPRLRLLYGCRIETWGAVSQDTDALIRGEWVTIGRKTPSFARPGREATTIADPVISREHFEVRWIADKECFEVRPISERVPLARLDIDGGTSPTKTPIESATQVAPNSLIAISDRVLIGLELGRVFDAAPDRLGMIGESETLWSVRDEILASALFDRPALVRGPTGAGKELVSRALHEHSPRRHEPLVAINGAALPESLVESTLFGHVKGAFTGAATDAPGVFRQANKGTLFIDEVGEIPLSVQPKLLRVLENGVVTPVGGSDTEVDVRLVAATNRDLSQEVEAGRFRADLLHRLNVHEIVIPPLRARTNDAPELFSALLSELEQTYPQISWLFESGGRWMPAIPMSFVLSLLTRPWDGNIRELRNVCERTARANLTKGKFKAPWKDEVEAPKVKPPPSDKSAASDIEALVRLASPKLGIAQRTLRKLLPSDLSIDAEDDDARIAAARDAARSHVLETLKSHRFEQRATASALSVSRTTLIRVMDDLELPRAERLTAEQVKQALSDAAGDHVRAAHAIGVAPRALKTRMTALNID